MIKVTQILIANDHQPILLETARGTQRGTTTLHRHCPLDSSEREKEWEVEFWARNKSMINRVAELLLCHC